MEDRGPPERSDYQLTESGARERSGVLLARNFRGSGGEEPLGAGWKSDSCSNRQWAQMFVSVARVAFTPCQRRLTWAKWRARTSLKWSIELSCELPMASPRARSSRDRSQQSEAALSKSSSSPNCLSPSRQPNTANVTGVNGSMRFAGRIPPVIPNGPCPLEFIKFRLAIMQDGRSFDQRVLYRGTANRGWVKLWATHGTKQFLEASKLCPA